MTAPDIHARVAEALRGPGSPAAFEPEDDEEVAALLRSAYGPLLDALDRCVEAPQTIEAEPHSRREEGLSDCEDALYMIVKSVKDRLATWGQEPPCPHCDKVGTHTCRGGSDAPA